MNEGFRPIRNTAPVGLIGTCKFYFRFLFDFQNVSIYRAMKNFSKGLNGKVLDIGCGDSPYRHLLNPECEYIGMDVDIHKDFGYQNTDILQFDGYNIPLENDSIDAVICTEVLEHVLFPEKLIAEIKRVAKPGGNCIITVPWSARNHYVPYDYHRYAFSFLEILFTGFSSAKITARGTDITVIASKIVVAYFRTFLPTAVHKLLLFPFALLFSPVLLLSIIIGHLSLCIGLGSGDDPLGYTVTLKK